MDETRWHRPEGLGVVRHDREISARRDDLLWALAIADEHLGGPVGTPVGAPAGTDGGSETPTRALREERALRYLDGHDDQAELARGGTRRACHQSRDVGGPTTAEATAELDLRGRRRDRLLGLSKGLFQAAQRVAQLVLAEDLAQARAVGLAGGLGAEVDVDRDVALNRRQALGDMRVLLVLLEVLFALGPTDLGHVGQHFLERPVALDQLRGGLVADARNPGDVVRGVALQAVEVRDQRGWYAVAVDHGLVVVDLRLGDPARGRHHLDKAPLVDQLEDVAVAGDDHHRHGWLGAQRPLGERGDQIVGLIPLDFHVAIPKRLHERFHRGPLLFEQIRTRAALGLVLWEQLGAPGGARVPRDHGRTDAVIGDDLHKHRGEPEDRVGRYPGGGRDRLR